MVKLTTTLTGSGPKNPFTSDPSRGSITKTRVNTTWTGLLQTKTQKEDSLFYSPFPETGQRTDSVPSRDEVRESFRAVQDLHFILHPAFG